MQPQIASCIMMVFLKRKIRTAMMLAEMAKHAKRMKMLVAVCRFCS